MLLYSRINDAETASSDLVVKIGYRLQGESWTMVDATGYNPTWNEWFLTWVLPSDAASGLYDVRVEAWDLDSGYVTQTNVGHFNVE